MKEPLPPFGGAVRYKQKAGGFDSNMLWRSRCDWRICEARRKGMSNEE